MKPISSTLSLLTLVLFLPHHQGLLGQANVTTGGGASNTIPVFTGSSSVGNSPLTVSGSNVGFGNASPTSTVDINGDINISGIFRVGGAPVLQINQSNGNYFLTNGGTASFSSTLGNVGMGKDVFGANTTGGYNAAVGNGALTYNTTGTNNVAVGPNALWKNVSGSLNVAVGSGALESNSTGFQNVGLGQSALPYNTTGYANLALGTNALYGNTIGNWNVAAGPLALFSLNDGTANTAVGSNSLTGIETGIDNVAVGDGAGDDASVSSNTSASRNTYLGASTQSLSIGDTNETVIGAYAIGNGSDSITLGNASVASTILRGKIFLTPAGSAASVTFPDGTIQTTAWHGVLTSGDFAELVDVLGDRTRYEPGDLIAIDPTHTGEFAKSSQAYSTLVAGVYSTKPGLVGRRTTTARLDKDSEVPMATTGIVPIKVTTENGPIEAGDLLVTSSQSGVAMKGTDKSRMLGAVLGKALGSLKSGSGLIECLVALQ